MISLPEKFLEDVKVILQDEYEEFIDSYNENKTTGLRLNTMKMSKEKFQKLNLFDLEQIPWTNEGFYYDESVCKPGKNPLHEAGVYYLQEPSAMSVVPKLDIQKGDRVLDMCAAPHEYCDFSEIYVFDEPFPSSKTLFEKIIVLSIPPVLLLLIAIKFVLSYHAKKHKSLLALSEKFFFLRLFDISGTIQQVSNTLSVIFVIPRI